jgi:hypothetical protein
MTEQDVRERARAFCEALMTGDIGQAAGQMSRELQANLGPVVAILPLPLTESAIASVDVTGAGFRVVLSLVGESDTVQLETRWKDRDGRPTMVEASRVPDEPPREGETSPIEEETTG